MVMTAKKKLPFRYSTRQRAYQMASKPFVENGRVNFILPQVGLLQGVLVRLRGGLSVSADSAFRPLAFDILRRASLQLNLGASNIFDLSGYGASLVQGLLAPTFGGTTPPWSTLANVNTIQGQFVPTLAGNPNPFLMSWYFPVSINDGMEFETGLINLQAPEVQCSLELQCGAFNDLFVVPPANTNGTALTFEVELWYYELPNPAVSQYPPAIVHRLIEENQPINNTGDNTYQIVRQGTLLQLIQYAIFDGVPTIGASLNLATNPAAPTVNSLNPCRVRINRTDVFYDMSRYFMDYLALKRYGSSMFPIRGAQVWDFYNAWQQVSSSDLRDGFDTEAVSEIEFINTVNGPLVGTDNRIASIRRIVQRLATQ